METTPIYKNPLIIIITHCATQNVYIHGSTWKLLSHGVPERKVKRIRSTMCKYMACALNVKNPRPQPGLAVYIGRWASVVITITSLYMHVRSVKGIQSNIRLNWTFTYIRRMSWEVTMRQAFIFTGSHSRACAQIFSFLYQKTCSSTISIKLAN